MTTRPQTCADIAVESLATRTIVRVLLYARISKDPKEMRAGVDRQIREGRRLCESLSNERELWVVTGTHDWPDGTVVDNDRSNSIARDRERENFGIVLTQMEAGNLDTDAVVFFDQDRFVKDEIEWARWIASARRFPVRVGIVGSGEIDVTSPDGYMMSVMRMMTANVATMQQVKRIKLFTADQAMQGKPNGRVMYGWQRKITYDALGRKIEWHDEIHPEQAVIVRECTNRIIAGEGLVRIADDLAARGIPAPSTGRKNGTGKWSRQMIRNFVLRSANIAVHIDEDGAETALSIPPILERAIWTRACLLLRDPARRNITDNRIRHLLTFIASCGKCGGPMRRAKAMQRGGYAWEGYVCRDFQHVAMREDVADDRVIDFVTTFLDMVDPIEIIGKDNNVTMQAADELELLEAELASYTALAQLPRINPARLSPTEYAGFRKSLRPQIEAARARSMVSISPGVDVAYALARSGGARRIWPTLALAQQRAVIDALFDVRINPANPAASRRVIDRSRIVVTRKSED